jgi:hypothetical protein
LKSQKRLHLLSLVRFLTLSLLLGFGMVTGNLLVGSTAHAQATSTVTITDCTDDSQLQSAVANAQSGDTINFGCGGDIKLTKALTIFNSLTLDGSGQSVTLDGQNQSEVMVIGLQATVTLNALTIANGNGNPAGGYGGGLFIEGSANITNSTFTGNAVGAVNSYEGYGGGLFNADGGTVNITNSTFSSNIAGILGGGIDNQTGTVNITNSTFTNNSMYSNCCIGTGAGAIENDGTMTITNSTFTNNSTGAYAGAIDNNGPLTITNSTIANNSSYRGGGLFNGGGNTVTITNSTITGNTVKANGGGFYNAQGTVNISGSIVANNTGGNCAGTTVSDEGYNLSSDGSCGLTGQGSLQNTDPKLDPNGLQNNGGPTQTMALQQTSPAIDQVPVANCPETDQRGMARPDDGETTCDMGAYESNYSSDNDLGLSNMPTNITTNATGPQGAVVTYTPPTVVDEDSPLPPVNCTPASGSTFAIGTTTVTCTVTDSDDTPSTVSASFTVTVNGAATQLNALLSTVNGFHFKKALQVTLDAELHVAQNALKKRNTRLACASLDLFNAEVKGWTGHGITSSQANQLITAARQIQAVLGC